jgi:hypothetical protein
MARRDNELAATNAQTRAVVPVDAGVVITTAAPEGVAPPGLTLVGSIDICAVIPGAIASGPVNLYIQHSNFGGVAPAAGQNANRGVLANVFRFGELGAQLY